MKAKSIAVLLGVLAVLYLALPAIPGDAATVVRKNGIRIAGEIVEETRDHVKVRTRYGDVTIKMSDVREIIREKKEEEPRRETASAQETEYGKRLSAAAGRNTPEAFVELARWCKWNGLKDEAKKACEKAVELDPDFLPARKALGHVRADGKWITKEEAEAKGYVENENGEWVSREAIEKKQEQLEEDREKAEKYLKSKEKEYRGVPWPNRHIIKKRHYEVHCNSSRRIAERYANIMEALYNKYRQVFAALDPDAVRSRVYIHRNHKEFVEMRGMPPTVGGFYMPRTRELYVYHGTFGLTGTTVTVLAHEGCHQFQHLFVKGSAQQFGRMPQWVIEGMAVIFEDAEISRGGKVKLNGPSPDRIRKLQGDIRDKKHVTLMDIMAPRVRFGGNHYNTAGTFTWWLLKDSKKKRYRVLYEQYLIQCVKDTKTGWGGGRRGRGGGSSGGSYTFADFAIKIAKKDITELEEEWRKYVLGIKLPKLGQLSGDTYKSTKELGFEITRANGTWEYMKESELSSGQIVCFQKPVPESKKKDESSEEDENSGESENLKAYARMSVYSGPNSLGATVDEKLEKWEEENRRDIEVRNRREADSSKHVSEFKVIAKKKVTVGGFGAAFFEYTIKNPANKWNPNLCKTRRVIICTPDRTYTIYGSAQADKFDEYKDDFQKMTESMKINPK